MTLVFDMIFKCKYNAMYISVSIYYKGITIFAYIKVHLWSTEYPLLAEVFAFLAFILFLKND